MNCNQGNGEAQVPINLIIARQDHVPVAHASSWKGGELKFTVLVLRLVVGALSMLALVLMLTDKETQAISVSLPGTSKPIVLIRSASFADITALKFYVISLSMVALYSLLHAIASGTAMITNRTILGSTTTAWITFILDQGLTYLLVSATAVVSEVAYIAEKGAPKVGWNPVCADFRHFCSQYGASTAVAYLSLLILFSSAGISAYHLFRLYGIMAYLQKSTP
ncbi:hypothetical protein O6H91_10G109900 [Diphasiastrum complanatum]|uniref:Uncharacterized protein n=1 Tax=Diphasiastrum complanatum TaxID=34168 RepID=A0ACC2CKJ9_DIPCM|nr:hypothetical protein O6H91_10G109900 [Diphasiastrum complanatum]